MFGSQILDVGIGLILVYLLLSFIASAVREVIETLMRSRAVHLERGIRELLHDPKGVGLARAFYQHPLIHALYRGDYDPTRLKPNGFMPSRSTLPSYIPARNFALALLDLAARPQLRDSTAASATVPPLTLDAVRATVAHIDNPAVQRVLLTAVDTAQNGLIDAQRSLEAWFDSSMDRVSGWYKRRTQEILLVIGLGIAVVGNVNTLAIANALYQDNNLRAAAVAVAEQARTDADVNARTAVAMLDSMKLPIGWPMQGRFVETETRTGRIAIITGWVLTALAVSLGAPFWFDLLNKMMVIRSTVKPHEKSREEGSEDRKDESNIVPTVSPEQKLAVTPPQQPAAPAKATAPLTPPEVTTEAHVFEKQAWADGEPDGGVI